MTPTQPQPNHSPAVPRSAFSLAEVLIAMGILTIGLLGVAAVFPVGGHYMQSGDIADRASAVAQAALEDAIIRGHLDPENWVALHFDIARNNFVPDPSETFARGLREALVLPGVPPLFGSREQYLGATYGGAYVIDPLGFSAAMDESTTDRADRYWATIIGSQPTQRFPGISSDPMDLATGGVIGYTVDSATMNASWWPWSRQGIFWPVRRVITTIDPAPSGPDAGRSTRAAALFTTSDDLALSLPTNGDEPARQRIESLTSGASTVASARQARGEYSWLLTVAPSSDAARNAFATQPDAYPVDVSAAVFYKRNVGRGSEAVQEAERLVTAQVVSTSPGGGEMLFTKRTNDASIIADLSPFEDLRGGHYVLVVGPHPQSTSSNPRLVLRWCRILNIEDTGRVNRPSDGVSVPLSRDNQVLVSLRGPDWPWQPSSSADSISNDLRVAIVPGVVAVHTKTMRLGADEGLEWAID